MKHETKFATVENVVTAICFGVGALLVVLALYTLMAVKPVNARNISQDRILAGSADRGGAVEYRLADRVGPGIEVAADAEPWRRHGTALREA